MDKSRKKLYQYILIFLFLMTFLIFVNTSFIKMFYMDTYIHLLTNITYMVLIFILLHDYKNNLMKIVVLLALVLTKNIYSISLSYNFIIYTHSLISLLILGSFIYYSYDELEKEVLTKKIMDIPYDKVFRYLSGGLGLFVVIIYIMIYFDWLYSIHELLKVIKLIGLAALLYISVVNFSKYKYKFIMIVFILIPIPNAYTDLEFLLGFTIVSFVVLTYFFIDKQKEQGVVEDEPKRIEHCYEEHNYRLSIFFCYSSLVLLLLFIGLTSIFISAFVILLFIFFIWFTVLFIFNIAKYKITIKRILKAINKEFERSSGNIILYFLVIFTLFVVIYQGYETGTEYEYGISAIILPIISITFIISLESTNNDMISYCKKQGACKAEKDYFYKMYLYLFLGLSSTYYLCIALRTYSFFGSIFKYSNIPYILGIILLLLILKLVKDLIQKRKIVPDIVSVLLVLIITNLYYLMIVEIYLDPFLY